MRGTQTFDSSGENRPMAKGEMVGSGLCGRGHKNRALAILLLPALFLFWFVTAPGADAVQRIVAGTEPRFLALLIRDAADAYQAPMAGLAKVSVLKSAAIRLGDFWWQVLDPPDTTP
jgi:hypothetical protein